MLLKTTQSVYVPPVAAVSYRPYSRTCPAPPAPAPPPVTLKTVCGYLYTSTFQASASTDLSNTYTVTSTVLDLPGFAPLTSVSPAYLIATSTSVLQSVTPYCAQVPA